VNLEDDNKDLFFFERTIQELI